MLLLKYAALHARVGRVFQKIIILHYHCFETAFSPLNAIFRGHAFEKAIFAVLMQLEDVLQFNHL
eukprot:c41365_g1_i1 orf=92-286(-)